MLQDQFDETAEVMKMQCEMPLGTMAEYLKIPELKKFPPAITALPKSWIFWTKTAGF